MTIAPTLAAPFDVLYTELTTCLALRAAAIDTIKIPQENSAEIIDLCCELFTHVGDVSQSGKLSDNL